MHAAHVRSIHQTRMQAILTCRAAPQGIPWRACNAGARHALGCAAALSPQEKTFGVTKVNGSLRRRLNLNLWAADAGQGAAQPPVEVALLRSDYMVDERTDRLLQAASLPQTLDRCCCLGMHASMGCVVCAWPRPAYLHNQPRRVARCCWLLLPPRLLAACVLGFTRHGRTRSRTEPGARGVPWC